MKKWLISLLSIMFLVSLSACTSADKEKQATSYLLYSDVFGNTALEEKHYSSSNFLDEAGISARSKTHLSDDELLQGALYVQLDNQILTKAVYIMTYDIEDMVDYSIITISELKIKFEELESEIDHITLASQGEKKQISLQKGEVLIPLNWVQRVEKAGMIESGIDMELGVIVNDLSSTVILSL